MRLRAAFLVLCFLALNSSPILAQAQDKELARKHFVLAQAHEQNGDYAQAAVEYLEAYEYFASPEFFYNAGRAYELGGEAAKAVEHYERYMALDPNGRAVSAAQAAIAKLKPQIQAQEPPPSERAAGTIQKPSPEAEQKAGGEPGENTPDVEAGVESATASGNETGSEAGGGLPTRSESGLEVTPAGRESSEGSRPLRITGLAVAGAGLLATAVGVKFALDASRLSNELESVDDKWTRDDLAKFDEGERARTLSLTFTGIGVAALVAGGSLYLWGRSAATAEERAQTAMQPLISADTIGFAVSRRF
ncbi:hypothetical protein [Haliangium ochraceum]|uniref:Tetratricopeptide TPR_2 repeat protein n=1 Tax=Haliangium ochraceum (strain DSM 14365 / JCM 11303 / SMP-2) TaxID=502025 RepID=D0LQM8_HALO1|nr:hypothetical protein [Haliangium ochraceum]ACY13588.1 Tetratricopeptide TPR_2 repeat protein [Haliangium ochraceum DSM 14365]